MLIRRDYAVVEPQRLLAQAQRVEPTDDDGAGAGAPARCTRRSGVLFGEYEPDEIASRHKEFGLEEGDSTLWVTAADEPPEPGEWLEAPFDQADPQRVVCRFDVSAVFDDDADDVDDDDCGGRARPDLAAGPDEDEDLDTTGRRSPAYAGRAVASAAAVRGRQSVRDRRCRPPVRLRSLSRRRHLRRQQARQPGRALLRRDLGHRLRQGLVHAVHHGQMALAAAEGGVDPGPGQQRRRVARAAPRPRRASACPAAWCAVSAHPCRTVARPAPSGYRRRGRRSHSRCSPSGVGAGRPCPAAYGPGAGT